MLELVEKVIVSFSLLVFLYKDFLAYWCLERHIQPSVIRLAVDNDL